MTELLRTIYNSKIMAVFVIFLFVINIAAFFVYWQVVNLFAAAVVAFSAMPHAVDVLIGEEKE